jgi:hypothetical protein
VLFLKAQSKTEQGYINNVYIKRWRHAAPGQFRHMNIYNIIVGLVSLLIGLTCQLIDRPRTAQKKRDIPLGLTEAQFKVSKWTLLGVGVFMTLYGLFDNS